MLVEGNDVPVRFITGLFVPSYMCILVAVCHANNVYLTKMLKERESDDFTEISPPPRLADPLN